MLLLIATCLFSNNAFAYEAEINGIYYNFNGDKARVTQKNYSGNSYSGSIVIPGAVVYNGKTYSVTSIEEYAFRWCSGLTSVTIPESVDSIGREAFYNCSALTSIAIPNSAISIGRDAFYGTPWYNNKPDGLVYVGKVAYKYKGTMPSQTKINIKEGTLVIADRAFYGYAGLASVTIPNSVTIIEGSAFSDCTGLTSVTIGNSVKSIGGNAFYNCSGLKKVIVPDIAAWCGITFGSYYDYDYSNPLYFAKHLYSDETTEITNLIIPNSVTSIGSHAFLNCSSLTSVTIPESVDSIGGYAFDGCTELKTVTLKSNAIVSGNLSYYSYESPKAIFGEQVKTYIIGDEITSIGDYLFYDCASLTSVTIGNSVTSIGDYAFSNCSGLTSVTIPNSVISIGGSAFYNCSGLKKVIVPDIAAWCGIAFDGYLANPLYFAKHLYSDETTEITNLIIPNSVTSIGNSAFPNCSSLTSVTIPNSVTSIGNTTFMNCTGLTSVAIGSSVKSIGRDAFYCCTGLSSVNISDLATWCLIEFGDDGNPLAYANHLYLNGKEITDLVIPTGITKIGDYLFQGCYGLTSVTIPQDVTSIGKYAFEGCSNLSSVMIPQSITNIGRKAFAKCKLRNVFIKCATPPASDDYNDDYDSDEYEEGYFSQQTFYHATLYVPSGSWDAYAFDNQWYRFINIRETATEEEQVTMQQAYTLMDANTFTYSVYDPVNNGIGTISSVGINEDNPNHSWQVITGGSKQYLYNLGAKKFATNGADGRLVLTAEPTPIDMKNGDNGIVLGSQAARQWALVGNDRLSVEQDIITGIDEIADTQQGESTSYDLQGRRIDKAQKGINIIRNADGTTKKVLMR